MARLTALFYSLLFLFSSCLQSARDVLIHRAIFEIASKLLVWKSLKYENAISVYS